MKRIIMWLVIAFAVFYLLSQPASAANAVKGAGQGLSDAAGQLVEFFHALA